jgi:predicted small lipoprotein YifL
MNSRYVPSLFLALLFTAGCGQKGPLYLPGDPSEIKTAVPPQNQSQNEEDDEDDEEETRQDN